VNAQTRKVCTSLIMLDPFQHLNFCPSALCLLNLPRMFLLADPSCSLPSAQSQTKLGQSTLSCADFLFEILQYSGIDLLKEQVKDT